MFPLAVSFSSIAANTATIATSVGALALIFYVVKNEAPQESASK
jgi:uncharacterized membrane protein YtjA (UPF0391 family)